MMDNNSRGRWKTSRNELHTFHQKSFGGQDEPRLEQDQLAWRVYDLCSSARQVGRAAVLSLCSFCCLQRHTARQGCRRALTEQPTS